MTKSNHPLEVNFSKNLFWDVHFDELDFEKNKRFIIQRTIEFGRLSDWKLIKKLYGLETIGQEMKAVRSLDDISMAFVSMTCGIRKEDFRCYTLKPSLPRHWNF